MANHVDFEFIRHREGGGFQKGYVPAPDTSRSGVTVASGFDLGARNASDLAALGLTPSLVRKLTQYCGRKGRDAVDLLARAPLTLAPFEVAQIDAAVRTSVLRTLELAYIASPSNLRRVSFFSLPAAAQTVIASVAFQYGNLAFQAPRFWSAVTAQNWREATRILMHFGDQYQPRRRLEAALLQTIVE